MGEFVRLDVTDGVGLVRLDRPPANAIDLQMGRELGDAVGEAGERDDVGAIVVWGGPRIFAAGADIEAMATWGPDEVRPSVEALAAACDLLATLPKISIAAVNGFALGGGCELALACDLRYAADDAQLGQPEIRIGVIPGAGGTARLVRLVGPSRARDLVYTGRWVASDEAARIGLVDLVVPPSEVLTEAMAGAGDLARGPRGALAAAKEAIRAAERLAPDEAAAVEREQFLRLFGTADQREGMRAFLDKRDPRFGAGH